MRRCKNNHFYDDSKFNYCPDCEHDDDSKTVALNSTPNAAARYERERQYDSRARDYSTMGSTYDKEFLSEGYLDDYINDDYEATVGVYKKTKGFDPVVGWLVRIEGASKGKDFQIRAERNFIGHDTSMDICIYGDNTISAKKHAIISFNPKELTFRIVPGDSHGIIYLNNNEVFNAEVLKRGDIIQIGQTSLIFIPLCDENFNW